MKNSSDEEDQLFYEDESPDFNIIEPHEREERQLLPNLHGVDELIKKCWTYYNEILKEERKKWSIKMKQLVGLSKAFNQMIDEIEKIDQRKQAQEQIQEQSKKISSDVQQNSDSSDQDENRKRQDRIQRQNQRANKNYQYCKKYQEKQFKLLILVCIKKHQYQYLSDFFDQFVMDISEKYKKYNPRSSSRKFNAQDQKSSSNLSEKQQKNGLKKVIQPSSLYKQQQQFIYQIAQQQDRFNKQRVISIRKIAMNIHKNSKFQYKFYFSKSVTQIQSQNIHILEDGIQDNCVLILPTYNQWRNVQYSQFSETEIVHINLFDHKELFIKLMYRCICDEQIMAYLPKQSLKIIDDMEDYPISFKQGTRRLIFLIEQLEILRRRKNIKFKFIQINTVFKCIQQSFKKTFIFENKSLLKKYLRCILDPGEGFMILEKYLNKRLLYENMNANKQEKSNLSTDQQQVKKLKRRLLDKLNTSDKTKDFCRFLNDKDTKNNKNNSKKDRKDKDIQRYGIDLNKNMDSKNLFQHQMRNLIKAVALEINSQASKFDWSQFHYIERIKPTIPYNIYNSTKRENPYKIILEVIEQFFTISLFQVIKQFCLKKQVGLKRQMSFGQLMYHLKNLCLFDLIDISHHLLRPIVNSEFFNQATYKNRVLK